MDVYDLGPIARITEDTGRRRLHGFNVIGVSGRPLVSFNYETEEEAAAAPRKDARSNCKGEADRPHDKGRADTPRRNRLVAYIRNR